MEINRDDVGPRSDGTGQPMRALAGTLAATLAGGAAGADTLPYTPHSVQAPDGVTLAVQEWANSEGPAIVFVHGFSASQLAWRQQVEAPELADEFRMITFDTRGSGMSDKPADRCRSSIPDAARPRPADCGH